MFLLYQSSENLKASNREFRRLFSLSSDLAETIRDSDCRHRLNCVPLTVVER
jgi:hypothetical protein